MKKIMDINKRSIGKEIGILSRAAHTFFQYQFKNLSIGHSQVMTLHFICKHNGLSQNKLVQHFGLDKSSVTSQLNILEKNGYITREIDKDDSRGRKIFITKKTNAIKDFLDTKFSSWSKILLKGFDEVEKEKLFNLLDNMIINAHKAINELKNNEENK